jgi:predicted phage-related endonuclease
MMTARVCGGHPREPIGAIVRKGTAGPEKNEGGYPMSIMELQARAKELRELKRMAEELEAEITAAEDAIKAAMGDQEQVIAGEYKITWKPVTTSRINTSALKAALPEIADRFTKATTTRRFQVA